jgi:hypothetical protein
MTIKEQTEEREEKKYRTLRKIKQTDKDRSINAC